MQYVYGIPPDTLETEDENLELEIYEAISMATERILTSTTFNSKCANTHDNNTRQGEITRSSSMRL
jgi:hypothetical protein